METMIDYSSRDESRVRLLQELPKNAVCAEVGVWKGAFSEEILKITEPKELNLIDPWVYQPRFSNSGFGHPSIGDEIEGYYDLVQEKFKDDPRVKIHRKHAVVAFSKMEDHYLDWIYLDGNQNMPFILSDLKYALAKVKPNGIIAGDDYDWQSDRFGFEPVKTAVTQILEKLGDQASFKLIDSQYLIELKRDA